MANENRIKPVITNHPSTESPSYMTNGMHTPNSKRPVKGPSYDWLGAMLRRKGVLLFALTVSGILGYLYHLRQPKVYSSSMKIMIWTQAPPRMVNGDTTQQPAVTTSKHVTLITSEVVMSKAGESSELRDLPTFAGDSDPMGRLRGMVNVSPASAADTLVLSANGPNPADLPIVLKEVMAAYQEILSEDSAAFSKSSSELIGKLQEKLADEKTTSERRFFELIQKLGVSPDPQTGKYFNPHSTSLEELKQLKLEKERALREVTERMNNVQQVMKSDVANRNELFRLLAIEASQKLAISSRSDVEQNPEVFEYRQKLDKLSQRISDLEDRIYDGRVKLQGFKRSVGDKHPAAATVSKDLDLYSKELSSLLAQRRTLQQDEIRKVSSTDEQPKSSGLAAVTSLDKELIQIYLASLQRETDQLKYAISGFDIEMETRESDAAEIRGEIEELNVLASQIKEKDDNIRDIVDQLSSLAVVSSNYTSTKVRVIESPGYGYQVAPKLSSALTLFFFSGGMIGLALVALLDWSDLSFRNPSEIRDKLGIPVVARIAKMPGAGKLKDGHTECLVTLERPKSAVAEAYRACRTALLFMARQNNYKCFLITSPSAGDGKSTTAINLAMCFAQGGQRTVIVDADLRRPRCHVYLGLPVNPGLKDFAVGDATEDTIIRKSDLHPNLSVVTAGKHFSNPSEFIDSAQFDCLLATLRERFDIVIVDSPPVLPVADSMALSSLCDGVVLVLKIRKGVVLSSEKAVDTLRSVSANMLGVIVNQVEKVSHYSDYGKYGYNGYGGYSYYAGRYYDKQNEKYYESESKDAKPE